MTVRSRRLLIAFGAASVAATLCAGKIRSLGYATDYAWFWVASRAVLRGENPYDVIRPGPVGEFYFDQGFLYPLPAAVVAVPLGLLPVYWASIAFAFLTTFAFALALTRDGWQRWPILISLPMMWSVTSGQWSPLIAAAALSPAFGWAAAIKPTLGFAAFVRQPTRRFILVGLVPVAIAFLLMPTWPLAWWEAMGRDRVAGSYHVPLLQPFGFLLLLALLRWKEPEARLLVGMAVVPQTMLLYDQLPLLLLARTRIQAYAFALCSFVVPLTSVAWAVFRSIDISTKLATLAYGANVITYGFYFPLLALVLWRKRVTASGRESTSASTRPSDEGVRERRGQLRGQEERGEDAGIVVGTEPSPSERRSE